MNTLSRQNIAIGVFGQDMQKLPSQGKFLIGQWIGVRGRIDSILSVPLPGGSFHPIVPATIGHTNLTLGVIAHA